MVAEVVWVGQGSISIELGEATEEAETTSQRLKTVSDPRPQCMKKMPELKEIYAKWGAKPRQRHVRLSAGRKGAVESAGPCHRLGPMEVRKPTNRLTSDDQPFIDTSLSSEKRFAVTTFRSGWKGDYRLDQRTVSLASSCICVR